MAEEHLQAVLAQRDQMLVEACVGQPQQLPQVQLGARPRGMSPLAPSRPAGLAPEAPSRRSPSLLGSPTPQSRCATHEVSICFMGLHPLILFCPWKSDSHLSWSV